MRNRHPEATGLGRQLPTLEIMISPPYSLEAAKKLKGNAIFPSASKGANSEKEVLFIMGMVGNFRRSWTSPSMEIELDNEHGLKNLEGIDVMINLRKISIEGCYGLENLNGLEYCQALEYLAIVNCGQITDLSHVSDIPLIGLDIRRTPITSLANLNLIKLEIIGLDLEQLELLAPLSLPALRMIGFDKLHRRSEIMSNPSIMRLLQESPTVQLVYFGGNGFESASLLT